MEVAGQSPIEWRFSTSVAALRFLCNNPVVLRSDSSGYIVQYTITARNGYIGSSAVADGELEITFFPGYGDSNWYVSYQAVTTSSEITLNLTDLQDVTISAPVDNALLAYDEGTTQWININLTASNVGGGSQVFKQKDVNDFEFRTLVAGSNKLSLVQNADDVTLDVDEANLSLANLGTKLLGNLSNVDIATPSDGQVLTYVIGTGKWTNLASAAGEINTGANVGVGGAQIFRDKTGTTLNFKSLIAGSNIVFQNNADTVEISYQGALNDLSNVTTTPSDNNVLKFNSTGGIWEHGQVDYSEITGVPADFTPSAHTLNSHSDVVINTPADSQVLTYNAGTWVNTTLAVGETNTASNQGTDGVGVYDTKVGVDLQFRNIAPASDKVSVVLNTKDIDLDVVEANLSLANLGTRLINNLSDVVLTSNASLYDNINSTYNPTNRYLPTGLGGSAGSFTWTDSVSLTNGVNSQSTGTSNLSSIDSKTAISFSLPNWLALNTLTTINGSTNNGLSFYMVYQDFQQSSGLFGRILSILNDISQADNATNNFNFINFTNSPNTIQASNGAQFVQIPYDLASQSAGQPTVLFMTWDNPNTTLKIWLNDNLLIDDNSTFNLSGVVWNVFGFSESIGTRVDGTCLLKVSECAFWNEFLSDTTATTVRQIVQAEYGISIQPTGVPLGGEMLLYDNGNWVNGLRMNLNATTDPTTSNDTSEGYQIGSRWFNVSTDEEFVCLDNTASNAVWQSTTLQTTYTASLGVERIGDNFQADLKANGGIVIETNELALDLAATSITGQLSALKIAGGTVDDTEFGYLNGVTSAIQTQLDSKLANTTTLNTLTDVNSASDPANNAHFLRWNDTANEWTNDLIRAPVDTQANIEGQTTYNVNGQLVVASDIKQSVYYYTGNIQRELVSKLVGADFTYDTILTEPSISTSLIGRYVANDITGTFNSASWIDQVSPPAGNGITIQTGTASVTTDGFNTGYDALVIPQTSQVEIDIGSSVSGSFTWSMVIKNVNAGGNVLASLENSSGDSGNNRVTMAKTSTTLSVITGYFTDVNTGYLWSSLSGKHVVTIAYDNSGPSVKIYINSTKTNDVSVTQDSSPNLRYLSLGSTGVGTFPAGVDVGECLVWDRALSDLELVTLQNQLMLTYGISGATTADCNLAIQELNNVSTASVANNQVIAYNSGNVQWENKTLDLGFLSDVNLSGGLSGNELLKFNSGTADFEPTNAVSGDIVGTSDSQTLTNKTIAAASNTLTIAQNDLSDTTITSAAVGEYLRYSGSAWVNSKFPMGELYVEGNVTASSNTTQGVFARVGAGSETASAMLTSTEFDNGGANDFQLRYTGTATKHFHLGCTLSFLSGANNNQTHFYLAKNGTKITGSLIKGTGGTSDFQSSAIHVMTSMATNDVISLWVMNNTSSNATTIDSLNLFAMGVN